MLGFRDEMRISQMMTSEPQLVAGKLAGREVNMAVNFRNLFDRRHISHAFNGTMSSLFGDPPHDAGHR